MKFKNKMEDMSEEKVNSEPLHHSSNFNKKQNPWMIASAVLGIAVIVLLVMVFRGGVTGNVISEKSAGDELVKFLNVKTGGGVTFVSSADKGNLYEVTVSYQSQNIPVYITKDGKYFVQGATPLTGDATASDIVDTTNTNTQPPQDLVKSDKPKVEAFIMTHCPYGTQIEKGIIPVVKALGTNADVKIRFVHYFMHGDKEEQETYRQLCIREEQSGKFWTYLEAFLEKGDSASALTKAGVDKTKLDACMASTGKAKDYYAADSKLSNQYGVQGSPTLVINGAQVDSGRSPDILKTTICGAFNKSPSACSQALSTASPDPGFGTGTTAASGSAANSAPGCVSA